MAHPVEVMEQKYLYLAGIGVTHSVAPPMHNAISKALHLPWTFKHLECPTVDFLIETFRRPDFAGGVVTMPYKKEVMTRLDGLDPLALQLGACNNVYRDSNGKLIGTNTDWRGIKGCLLSRSSAGRGQPALIVGAGGAARAAVYALFNELQCHTIYVINRDAVEVADLERDCKVYAKTGTLMLNLVHITSVAQAETLEPPVYVVGTVPDFEPQTEHELLARASLETFLKRGQSADGVLLDMCFKPRFTRHRKLGESYAWKTVDGVEVIGHQIGEQWRLWAGDAAVPRIPQQQAWDVLKAEADKSTVLNA